MFSSIPSSKKAHGFTLIEMVIVIIILAVLAATAIPKFITIKEDAQLSTVQGTAGAFAAAIELAHMKWLSTGNSGPADNLQVYGTDSSGELDFNEWGFPAQHWPPFEANPKLDNTEDCISVWITVLAPAPSVSLLDDLEISDYQVTYPAVSQCLFTYNAQPNLSIRYNAQTGHVNVEEN
ncbi:type II secretion system protein [Psychromonas hadalis]|uniref:type II secretion system protein n=1 Tax=Psychromonas hadalis TaxID=211669 RepID=UPI0003B7871C|nr:type II secretion system protein [Psychromonas hadalis]